MSGTDRWEESLRKACATLRALREELQAPSPGVIFAGSRRLTEAAESLRRFAAGAPDGPATPSEVAELESELAGVRDLLEQAAAYYLSWSKVLGAAAGGYGVDGKPPLPTGGSVVVRG